MKKVRTPHSTPLLAKLIHVDNDPNWLYLAPYLKVSSCSPILSSYLKVVSCSLKFFGLHFIKSFVGSCTMIRPPSFPSSCTIISPFLSYTCLVSPSAHFNFWCSVYLSLTFLLLFKSEDPPHSTPRPLPTPLLAPGWRRGATSYLVPTHTLFIKVCWVGLGLEGGDD